MMPGRSHKSPPKPAAMSTHYENLGISPKADNEQIRRAFRKLAQQHHPDKNGDSEESNQVFRRLYHSYEVLSDSVKRAAYDSESLSKKIKRQNPVYRPVDWLAYLKRNHIIIQSVLGRVIYHRLSNGCRFQIPEEKVALLRSNKDPSKTGGLFLFSPHKRNGKIVCHLKEIVFIENIFTPSSSSFVPYAGQLRAEAARALSRGLIPCRFHLHLTKGIIFTRDVYWKILVRTAPARTNCGS